MLVHTDEGISGLGRGGDPAIVRNELAPLLIGQDPRRTALLWQRMYDHAWRFRGPDRAAFTSIGSLDIALWDIVGKASGQPVWRLLGGYTDRVEVYADGIGYVDEDPETVAALVKKHADEGYSHVKFHLSGYDNDAALEKVRLAREAVGPDVRVMLDAHRMWHGTVAAEMARKFEPYKLYWIEEPVRGRRRAALLQHGERGHERDGRRRRGRRHSRRREAAHHRGRATTPADGHHHRRRIHGSVEVRRTGARSSRADRSARRAVP